MPMITYNDAPMINDTNVTSVSKAEYSMSPLSNGGSERHTYQILFHTVGGMQVEWKFSDKSARDEVLAKVAAHFSTVDLSPANAE